MVGTTEHLPRVVRISVTDADATDSSSDDDHPGSSSERRRVKRFISHVKMERRLTTTTVTALSARSRRQPSKRKRRRLNAGGKTTSSSVRQDPVIKLSSPDTATEPEEVVKFNVCSSESFGGPFDTLFSGDFFACDAIVPSVLDLFADPGWDPGHVCEFGSLFVDTYSIPSSDDDFGFSISGATWPADEHMLDVGEIFGSDPVVAI